MLEHTQGDQATPKARNRRDTVRTAAGKEKRDFINARNLEQAYKFSIVKKCKDSLEWYITEGICIKEEKHKINNMIGNGFIT